jgi:hypothetical protein
VLFVFVKRVLPISIIIIGAIEKPDLADPAVKCESIQVSRTIHWMGGLLELTRHDETGNDSDETVSKGENIRFYM